VHRPSFVAAIGDELPSKALASIGLERRKRNRDDGLRIWYGSCVILDRAALGIIPPR